MDDGSHARGRGDNGRDGAHIQGVAAGATATAGAGGVWLDLVGGRDDGAVVMRFWPLLTTVWHSVSVSVSMRGFVGRGMANVGGQTCSLRAVERRARTAVSIAAFHGDGSSEASSLCREMGKASEGTGRRSTVKRLGRACACACAVWCVCVCLE